MRHLSWLAIFLGFLVETPIQAEIPVIIIDPGHGGQAVAGSLKERTNSSPNNATTPGGILEKDLTLEFSRILREVILEEARKSGPQVGVLLTREDDRNLNFAERAAIAHRSDTACIVSIHFNAGGGGKAMGSLALIGARARNPNYEIDHAFGKRLAEACSRGVQQYLPASKSRGVITDGHLHGGLGSNFFFQLARHRQLRKVPKCFLEIEFIDNPVVEKALLGKDRGERFRTIAREIATSLLEQLEPTAKERPE
jgi:N-acetylmuramoyl-L-alanine amidase